MIIDGIDQNGQQRESQFLDELLKILAVGKSEMAYVSKVDGRTFSWSAVSADIDAGDTALLLCNDDPERKLYIAKVNLWCDVAQQFTIHSPAYATFAGTAVVGTNLNRASSNIALATAKADETANTQGTIITTVRNNELATDVFAVDVDFEGALVLGYHQSVAVDLVAEPGAFEATIYGYYK